MMTLMASKKIDQKCPSCGRVRQVSKIYFDNCNECLNAIEAALKRGDKMFRVKRAEKTPRDIDINEIPL